jgi:peptidylprolyl isomerase
MSKTGEYKINNGDFVLIEYTGYIKETNEIFDTTDEKTAKDANIFNPQNRYGPTLVIVGEKWTLEGLEESLIGKREGEEFEIEIPPEKGFGVRDSKKITTTTIRKLRESGVKGDIVTGNIIEVEGRPAIIRAVVSGRVMLDFNPPLAGKHLIYKVKITKLIKDLNDKIKSLINHVDSTILEKTKLKILKKDGKVMLDFGDNAINSPNLHLVKKPIADNILKYISEIKEVQFIDRVVRAELEGKEESLKTIEKAEPKQS